MASRMITNGSSQAHEKCDAWNTKNIIGRDGRSSGSETTLGVPFSAFKNLSNLRLVLWPGKHCRMKMQRSSS